MHPEHLQLIELSSGPAYLIELLESAKNSVDLELLTLTRQWRLWPMARDGAKLVRQQHANQRDRSVPRRMARN
jgi:hypothetical protein